MAVEILEKQKLDSQFSILNSLSASEMHRLAKAYERLETGMKAMLRDTCEDDPWFRVLKNQIVDVADRTEMIYRFLQRTDHGDSAS
jgi:hypothetical protein